MANMDIISIVEDLKNRFSAPLEEFYRRRIIFWLDEEGEFSDQVDELDLGEVKFVRLTGKNNFAVKKLLSYDDLESNFLVYSPLTFEEKDDNWLLGVQNISEEFRSDLYTVLLNEMNLPNTETMRSLVKEYHKFFAAKKRRVKFQPFVKGIKSKDEMQLAILATLCGEKLPDSNAIIKAVLKNKLDFEENDICQSFVKYGLDNVFWARLTQYTGYGEGESSTLVGLLHHILLTACTRTIDPAIFSGLPFDYRPEYEAFCYDFVSEWIRSGYKEDFYTLACKVEAELNLCQRFSECRLEELFSTACFPCIDTCILSELMKEINEDIIHIDLIKECVESRKIMPWYGKFSDYYESILQVAFMHEFYRTHAEGFHLTSPKEIWKTYQTDYYNMDTYYRQFQVRYQRCLIQENSLLDELKSVQERVERLYSQWFLESLGQNWSQMSADDLAEFGQIPDVAQQKDFYNRKISHKDKRVFVIISDALRYEVAVSLNEQLRQETQCEVNLDSMEAIFPTTTKFGMAALLPHKELQVIEREGKIVIYADNLPTDASNREKVLQAYNKKSVALKYNDLIPKKREERFALVKGMEVVYIYHNKIDEVSHHSPTGVFSACDEAIEEINHLIRIITNEFGGVHIYVTADHGFLYTHDKLKAVDKLDKSTLNREDVEFDHRYMIVKKGAKPDYLLPIKFTDELDAFSPRAKMRIKKKGEYTPFVHGGTSLQEMLVPLIYYHFLRNDNAEYIRNPERYNTKPVTICPCLASQIISNTIFSLNFYQEDAVGDNRSSASFLLYFVDSKGEKISDTVKIIADKTSPRQEERTFHRKFNLKSRPYSSQETYTLLIKDESSAKILQKFDFNIQIAFSLGEGEL